MTIEFRCPYCTAPIQVADQAAGTPGRCPRCAAKLTVPRPAGLQPPPPPAAPPSAAPAPAVEPAVPAVRVPPPDPLVALDFSQPETVSLPAAPPGAFPIATKPVVRKVRRRRRGIPILVPISCVLLVVGLVGWVLWLDWSSRPLVGELNAVELEAVDLEPALVSRELLSGSNKQRDELLAQLETLPIPMISDLMQVQFRGSSAGLVVSITRGAKSAWYRVDVGSHPALAAYIQSKGNSWLKQRSADLIEAAAGFSRQYSEVTQKKAAESTMLPYRDQLGLTALTRGLGHQAVAIVGRTMYPCVYEEADGTLYFLLPPNLREFTFTGRKPETGEPLFTGEFTVKVKPQPGHTPAPGIEAEERPPE
jgi:hypothetical protein